MSAKRSSDETEAPHTAIIPQPVATIKDCTDIVLPDDVLRVIVTFVDSEGLSALACVCEVLCDAVGEEWLARDKVAVLKCFLAMGGKEDTLRRRYKDKGEWKMRDEPSDNVSEWLGIGALDGLTQLSLHNTQICGHLPSEIGRLTHLSFLWIEGNRLEGPLPAELGALTEVLTLFLHRNNFTGEIPSTLANLTRVDALNLRGNNFITDVPSNEIYGDDAQLYLAWLNNPEEEFPSFSSGENEGDY